jgi:hypothetical protein
MPTPLALDRVLTRPLNQPLGRYQLLGRLGAGGMAEVFVARAGELAGLQSLVAVKRVLPHLAEDDAFVALFRREAQISLRLRHRAIARVVEVGCAGGAWFLAMELVPGESLAHLLRAEREAGASVDPRLVAWVGAEIASALHHAHTLSEGGAPIPVIHRDVSPQNVLLGFDGAAKLIDFGVARCAHLSDATRTGTVRGKLAYASPEQLGARPLDGRSDLFSLAVVLHEWIAGAPLFACDSDAATVQAVQAAVIPAVPRAPRLSAVLARALSRDPALRFADGEALADALLDAAGGRPAAPERLVGAHLRALFPDRDRRWQAIVAGGTLAGRPLAGVAPQPDGERATGDAAGDNGTVASASAFGAQASSTGMSARTPAAAGSGTLARRRRRRTMALSLAAAMGFASLVVGWVRRSPTSSPASRISAAPAISEAKATATADRAAGPRDQASASAPPSVSSPVSTPSSADGKLAPGARAPFTPRGASRRRAHHAAAAGARRAIVDELEPSPYVRR